MAATAAASYCWIVRVGLVGCGRWGQYILRDLRALHCQVPVVARSRKSVERARQGGAAEIVPVVGSFRDVEGVVVATPTSTHANVIAEALELAVPVFVEKPLCADAGAAKALAEQGSGRLFVMDKWRYHPGIVQLATLARNGLLGEVRALRTIRVGWGNPHDDVDSIWVLTPHDLAIALEVLGRLLPATGAVAQLNRGAPVSLIGIMKEDSVSHVLEVSERAPASLRRIELHCEDGIAVLGGGWDEHVSVYRGAVGGPVEEERLATPGELPLLAELRAFLGYLNGGPPPRSSAVEGARIVETIGRLRALAGIS
jgi:predicted dehydrogenase